MLIEAEAEEQLEKLKDCCELQGKGLIFDKPKKRSPRLLVYDVDPPENDDELLEVIYDQNMRSSEISLETFKGV